MLTAAAGCVEVWGLKLPLGRVKQGPHMGFVFFSPRIESQMRRLHPTQRVSAFLGCGRVSGYVYLRAAAPCFIISLHKAVVRK